MITTLQKAKALPRGKPFQPGNQYAAKPGEVRNPHGTNGARSMGTAFGKLLAAAPSDATKDRLHAEFGTEPMTMAEVIAMQVILAAAKGSVAAAREIRAATESDMLHFADMSDEQIVKRLEEQGVESLPDLTDL